MRALVVLLFGLGWSLVQAQTWQTDAGTARIEAQATGRPILLNFSGSDWCAPCKRLADEVFADSLFIRYAQDHLVLLNADFPMRRANALPPARQAANDSLAARYDPDGVFPCTVLIDPAGDVLVRVPERIARAADLIESISPYVP